MDRNGKETWIAELSNDVKNAQTLVVADYKGLSVAQMTELRNKAREAGVQVKVTKNRLTRIALKGTSFEGASNLFAGTTLVAYAEDVVAPAKVLQAFAKTNKKLVLKGGVMNATVLDQAEVLRLAATPSLIELRGMIAGIIMAPAGNVARALKAFSEKAA